MNVITRSTPGNGQSAIAVKKAIGKKAHGFNRHVAARQTITTGL